MSTRCIIASLGNVAMRVGSSGSPSSARRSTRWLVATEAKRINHLAAPQICPTSYAAIFWDQHFRTRYDPSEVKFVRVPNRAGGSE